MTELTQKQVELFRSRNVNGVLATVDLEGNPNTAPIHLMWAPNAGSVSLALAARHQSTENLKTQGRYSLSIMEADDQAFSIQGIAKLVRQPMEANPHMVLFKLTVNLVKSDTAPTVKVVQAVKTEKRSEKVLMTILNK
jgi:hypothetical protein